MRLIIKRLLSILVVSLVALPSLAETGSAVIGLYGKPYQSPDGTVQATFKVTVRDCRRSEGGFDFTLVFQDMTGETDTLTRTGKWGPEETTEPLFIDVEVDELRPEERFLFIKDVAENRFVCHAPLEE